MRVAAAALVALVSGCFLPDPGVGRCDLQAGAACRPGYFCSPDGGCAPTRCEVGATEACALSNQDYGEYVCGDAGWSTCAASTAAACSRQRGVCVTAVRRFGDVPGCSDLSYARNDSGYQRTESCPADQRDNDCDGYVDEISDDLAQLTCGKGLCLADAGGVLRVYRRCGEAACPVARLATLPGWRALDTCDGLDLDCSGLADVGPDVTLGEGSAEVAVLRDSSSAAYLIATDEPASDGGIGLLVRQLDVELQPVGVRRSVGVRSSPGPFVPNFTPAANLPILVWRNGLSSVAAARVFDGDTFPVNLAFTPPARVVRGPYASAYGGKVLLSAAVELTDGGVIESLHTGALPFGTNPPLETWTTDCTGPELCLPGKVQVWGNATDTGLGVVHGFDTALLVVLSRAGPPNLPPDIGWEPASVDSLDFGSSYALGGYGELKIVSHVGPTRAHEFVVMQKGRDAGFLFTPKVLDHVPQAAALDVAPAPDGGVRPIYAWRHEQTLTLLGGVGDGGTILSTVAQGQPSVAWSPLRPNHALVTNPERRPDGGTAVVGRLVCVPR